MVAPLTSPTLRVRCVLPQKGSIEACNQKTCTIPYFSSHISQATPRNNDWLCYTPHTASVNRQRGAGTRRDAAGRLTSTIFCLELDAPLSRHGCASDGLPICSLRTLCRKGVNWHIVPEKIARSHPVLLGFFCKALARANTRLGIYPFIPETCTTHTRTSPAYAPILWEKAVQKLG